jgi:hypothetical protein
MFYPFLSKHYQTKISPPSSQNPTIKVFKGKRKSKERCLQGISGIPVPVKGHPGIFRLLLGLAPKLCSANNVYLKYIR